ncbi:DUF2272 domain-containing protein [Mitsuaria sp. GD03876]|uniref:DUF2272 domain-containing protein n=1 Tax=Mitsuaria sp. GD03876 TaxID=2975399 RepID=UPI002448975D|nr:DUF2272 domain-containing protein [Mitsuaria sp. GD03876]MDH0867180.1 DUF2272 domain-containing protein [Mitsuaria sp. GD03876]
MPAFRPPRRSPRHSSRRSPARFLVHAALAVVPLVASFGAAAQSCEAPGPAPALGARIASIAMAEYQRFNGHRIDAHGRLWKFGSVETETEPLRAAEGDAAPPADRYAWRRVWTYWQTLEQHRPGTAGHRDFKWAPSLLDDPASASPSRVESVGALLAAVPADAPRAEQLREALVRAAIADSPWSGAFISFVMHEAGLSDQAFHFAGAHAVYIAGALRDEPGYAFRACDIRRTAPRVGDLICYSRGQRVLETFADWQARAGELDGRTKSHCDVVVSVDPKALKIESIGGNVLQAVTRRQLMVNEAGLLARRHYAGAPMNRPRPGSPCAEDASCEKSDLNQQHWGVLLQLR